MDIREALLRAYDILKDGHNDTYKLDSQLLLGKVIGKDRMFTITNRDYQLTDGEVKEFFSYVELRRKKMPIKYILNKCEFMGIDFFVRPGVLIPRPDTEILVEWALKTIKHNVKNGVWSEPAMVCDLCCGSGAIGLSIGKLLNEDSIKTMVDLFDISDDALDVTSYNIKSMDLSNFCNAHYSDMLESSIREEKKYHMLLSNPPYISDEDMKGLMDDVKNYEPELALCGGSDGLNFYRKIAHDCRKVILPCGCIGLEIGYNQGEAVSELLRQNNFKDVNVMKDFNGLDRVVIGHL
ncbi:release factor glutamine methyltransferase [Hathewaya proteolytica DSM 3090]|uniref:Release factor glutamine methyltransferase n=1 Tax=Hathewaya proteolytica DSM 3090 TaxID=1121331 RepID=A0A1M6S8F7_9CLOT|nr:peptide chain release factor N(5)-glutamine methyltransferase [Hathewaya proteolytica]SHK41013.1 release factor glutamine methyltransferase [Hathewaya proteolytica DSM 3090]